LIREATKTIQSGTSLQSSEMIEAMDYIMEGSAKDAEIKSFLVALFEKGETADELTGAATSLRKHMSPIESNRSGIVDTCGTGGGKTGTFNISTAAAIVAASAGASVAKHGNRRSTSLTGSADVLEEMGVNVDCSIETVQKCLNQLGICFCYAPLFHPSVKNVSNVRKKLKHRTIFNLIGPLCNPANAKYQVLGAGLGNTRPLLAQALAKLGTERSIVVHSRDGIGEISVSEITDVSEVLGTQVREGQLAPSDFGLETSSVKLLRANSPSESADVIKRVMEGQLGPQRDIVVANAAAALWISGICDGLLAGAERCARAIDNGQAGEILKELVDMTNKN
jgi:anthranilate phosphoribosyltransferase